MAIADFRIDGGTIIDGTGEPGRIGRVAIQGGRIVVTDDAVPARRIIDADGAIVSPGFIDLHTHSDFTLPLYPAAAAMVHQGVTTQVTGNCGFSPFPAPQARLDELMALTSFIDKGIDWDRCTTADDYVRYVEDASPATNVVLQVGLGTVRVTAMGFDRRPPTSSEREQMETEISAAFDAGALGISSGLVYAPGSYASAIEVGALVSIAAARGGFYSTHIRNEGAELQAAIEEALATARSVGAPLQISHHKAIGSANWGSVSSSLAQIDRAIDLGQDVLADVYPYRAGSTTLIQILPTWALAGGIPAMRRNLQDPVVRKRIAHEMTRPDAVREFDPNAIVLAEIPPGPNAEHEGRSLADLAADAGQDALDVAFRLLVEEGAGIVMVVFGMAEDDVRQVMSHPAVAIASDGWTLDPSAGGTPHPRNYGTFPRVLGRYVREEGVLSLEAAVHKMTGLPARRLRGLRRGHIETGFVADIVVFDPAAVADVATYSDPHRFSVGLEHVFVSGVPVIEDRLETGARPGSVLTRQRRADPVE